jgi:cyclophilin family peptidyl-prolyl cis-trans isomerase
MNINKIFPALFFISFLLFSCSGSEPTNNIHVLIKTTLGDIKIVLSDETPVHRDNFIKLIKEHFYDGIVFHRVIKDFMIQTGDPMTRRGFINSGNDTLLSYTLPAEFNPRLYHKKGALAAAREGNDTNPEMRSSGTQFYIVQGKRLTSSEVSQAEQMVNNNIKKSQFLRIVHEISDSCISGDLNLTDAEIQDRALLRLYDYLDRNGPLKFTEDQKSVYENLGGVPRLDGTYTVFGEVVEGLDVVDRIAEVQTDDQNRPVNDIVITGMKIVKK